MQDLQSLTTPKKLSDRFLATIPEGWQQGRGAFGGIVLSTLTRALQAALKPEALGAQSLRSLTAALCGPTQPGEAHIFVEVLRLGSGVSTLAARLVQNDEVQAHAVAVFGKSRVADGDWQHAPTPTMPPWRELEPIAVEPPLAPQFTQFFEFRATGQFPFSGSEEASAAGWIRPKHPGALRDEAYIVALADCWWPAALARFTEPRPAATISFTLEILNDLQNLDPNAPLYHTGVSQSARGGYTSEERRLWGEDGRLISINHQTIAIIR